MLLSLSLSLFFFNGEILSPSWYHWCLWYLTELDKVGAPKKACGKEGRLWLREKGKGGKQREGEKTIERAAKGGGRGETEKRQEDKREEETGVKFLLPFSS